MIFCSLFLRRRRRRRRGVSLAIEPAAGESAWSPTSQIFCSFNPKTSRGGKAAVGTSSYRSLQAALGPLLSWRLVVSSKPELAAPLFCLRPIFESLPPLGSCDLKRPKGIPMSSFNGGGDSVIMIVLIEKDQSKIFGHREFVVIFNSSPIYRMTGRTTASCFCFEARPLA